MLIATHRAALGSGDCMTTLDYVRAKEEAPLARGLQGAGSLKGEGDTARGKTLLLHSISSCRPPRLPAAAPRLRLVLLRGRRLPALERSDWARDCTIWVMTRPAAMLPPKVAKRVAPGEFARVRHHLRQDRSPPRNWRAHPGCRRRSWRRPSWWEWHGMASLNWRTESARLSSWAAAYSLRLLARLPAIDRRSSRKAGPSRSPSGSCCGCGRGTATLSPWLVLRSSHVGYAVAPITGRHAELFRPRARVTGTRRAQPPFPRRCRYRRTVEGEAHR